MATVSKVRCLRLSLPEAVKRVPSHLSWMEELSGHLLEQFTLERVTSLKEYLQPIVDMRNKQFQKDVKEELLSLSDEMEVAKYLNWAAMNVYLGELKFAEENLKVLDRLEDNPWELTSGKLEVFQYCRDVLRWAMQKDSLEDSVVDKLLLRWDAIFRSNKGKAIVCFLKAKLSQILGIPEESSVQFYMDAIELEPGCALWYQRAYRSTRKIRLATYAKSPSEDEEYFAWAAFELAPNNVVTLTSYAVMLKDKIWRQEWSYWETHEEEYLEVVQLLTRALQLAKEKQSKKWARFASGYLGEVYCFGRSNKLDRWEGLRLLEECAKDNPDTWILHKFARVYHYGFRGWDMPKVVNFSLAEEIYLRALEDSTTNFPCLLDYLKLLNILQRFVDMMRQLDKALMEATEPIWVAKLRGLRAYLMWAKNPNNTDDHKSAAVQEFLTTFEKFPNYEKQMLNHHCYLDFCYVKEEIVKYCREVYSTEKCDQRVPLLVDVMSQYISNFPMESSGENARERVFQQQMQNLSIGSPSKSEWRTNDGERGGKSTGRQEKTRRFEGSQGSCVGRRYSTSDEDANWRK